MSRVPLLQVIENSTGQVRLSYYTKQHLCYKHYAVYVGRGPTWPSSVFGFSRSVFPSPQQWFNSLPTQLHWISHCLLALQGRFGKLFSLSLSLGRLAASLFCHFKLIFWHCLIFNIPIYIARSSLSESAAFIFLIEVSEQHEFENVCFF